MRIFIPVFASAVLGLVGASSAFANGPVTAAPHKSHVKQSAGYVKPGAAVTLSHDYDGSTATGNFETLTASLSHVYQDGHLSVGLLTQDEIQISGFTPIRNMPVSSGSILDIPIQFSSLVQGHFTLSLDTVYRDPDGNESRRVLSILVSIGGETFEKSSAQTQVEINTVSKTDLIGLPAIEVIE